MRQWYGNMNMTSEREANCFIKAKDLPEVSILIKGFANNSMSMGQ